MSRKAERFWLAGALALAICLRWWDRWYLVDLYYGGYSTAELLPYLVGLACAVFAGAMAASRLPGGGAGLRALLLLTFLYSVWWAAKEALGWTQPVATLAKVALALAVSAAAVWLSSTASAFWSRAPMAIVTVALIYAATPLLLLQTNRLAPTDTLGFEWLDQEVRRQPNLVYVIFDETSPDVTATWIDSIRKASQPFQSVKLKAAGKNTGNAVPAMLTGDRFDDVAPCGATTMCSLARSVDFSTLRAARADVDVVGFWHPYCAIQGLRSCYRELGAFLPRPHRGFVCQLPGLGTRDSCKPPAGSRDNSMRRLEEAVFDAAFWNVGGILLVHVPLPHPSMEAGPRSLRREYLHSVDQANVLIQRLLDQLSNRFGDRFLLVLTSDHSLRVEIWCNQKTPYQSANCATGLPPNEGLVPFIVAGPMAAGLHFDRQTAVGLLSAGHGAGDPAGSVHQ